MEFPPTDAPDSSERISGTESEAAHPPSPDRPFKASDIFFAPDGLRAVWGIVLFIALCAVLLILTHPLVKALAPSPSGTPGLSTARRTLVGEGVGFLCVAFATWVMAKIEHRSTSAYGFASQYSVRNFAAGLAWGLTLLSLLVAILRASRLLVFDARLLVRGSVFSYGLIWLVGFLLVGLLEEFVTRGYLQFTLTRAFSNIYRRLFGDTYANAFGFWTAALILSFVFGLSHRSNPGESPLGMLSAGLAGFVFCLSLWRTGSLWWAIGFHTSWDWAQSFLYGVADSGTMVKGHLYATHAVGPPYLSGGLTGPEGSLYMLPIMLTGAAIILFTLPRTHSGYQPASTPQPSLD